MITSMTTTKKMTYAILHLKYNLNNVSDLCTSVNIMDMKYETEIDL